MQAESNGTIVIVAYKPKPGKEAELLQAIARGKREQIITLHGKFFVQLDRFFPWVTRALAERISARRDKT